MKDNKKEVMEWNNDKKNAKEREEKKKGSMEKKKSFSMNKT